LANKSNNPFDELDGGFFDANSAPIERYLKAMGILIVAKQVKSKGVPLLDPTVNMTALAAIPGEILGATVDALGVGGLPDVGGAAAATGGVALTTISPALGAIELIRQLRSRDSFKINTGVKTTTDSSGNQSTEFTSLDLKVSALDIAIIAVTAAFIMETAGEPIAKVAGAVAGAVTEAVVPG